MRDIGKNIHDLRIKQNMTQDELAEKLFVTRQTVSNYETGRSRPDVDMLSSIAQALNTDPNTLLYGPAPVPSRKPQLMRLVPALALLAVVIEAYYALYEHFTWLASRYFLTVPGMWLGSLGKPLVFLIMGWTAMQALILIRPIPLFPFATAKKMKRWLFGILILYILFVASFLIIGPMISRQYTEFVWHWSQVFYTVLGARAGQHSIHGYLICAFILGALFRLCGFPVGQDPKPET